MAKIVLALVLLLLAYPVLGTLALWTGLVERVLESEDLRVEIENPAWTIWPGRVHMERVRILVNGEEQFILEGDDIVGNVQLISLFRRRFHVTELRANDVRYRMRVQVKTTRGIEERVAAYPPMDELPGDPVLLEKEAEKTEERESPWTVQVERIDVGVTELWFFEYRYLGPGRLRGGFLRGPGRMRVDTSVQHLGPGDLRFGADRIITKNLRGQVSARIPELDPEAHADEGFLEFVTAHVQLKADIETLRHVSAYLSKLDVRDGAGPFATDLMLDGGRLGSRSMFRFDTNKIRLIGDGYRVTSDWHIDTRVASNGDRKRRRAEQPPRSLPHLLSQARSTRVSFTDKRDNAFTLQLRDHEQRVTLDSTALGRKTGIEHASLNFPKIMTNDMDDLSVKDGAIQSRQGVARASLRLDSDDGRVLRGAFQARFDDVKLLVAGVELGGQGRVRSEVKVDLEKEHTTLKDIHLGLSNVMMNVGDEYVDQWWMKMSAKRLDAWGLPPDRMVATFAVRAKDAEPLLEALAEKDKLNDLIAKFTSLDDLELKATIRIAKDLTDVMIESLESDVWDVSGRISTRGKKTKSALVIGGKAVSIGIANDGKTTDIQPFAGADWLNEKLRNFPPPTTQVKPPKP